MALASTFYRTAKISPRQKQLTDILRIQTPV